MGWGHWFSQIRSTSTTKDRINQSKYCVKGTSCTLLLWRTIFKNTVYSMSYRILYGYPCYLSRYNFTQSHISHLSKETLSQPEYLLLSWIFVYWIDSCYRQCYSIQVKYSIRSDFWSFHQKKFEETLHVVWMGTRWKKSTQPDVWPRYVWETHRFS